MNALKSKTMDSTRQHALITGGAGFIGRHLTDRLLKEGIQVRILDDFSSGNRDGLAPDIEIMEASILDQEALSSACQDMDMVFHLAAVASVPECDSDPANAQAINVDGSRRVAESCQDSTLVFASSSAVYGDVDPPCHEDAPASPCSDYARGKLAAESFIHQHPASTSLRLFNVIGPGQRADSLYSAVVPIFIRALMMNAPLTIHGDGQQTRDFVPVDMTVEAMLRAAHKPAGQAINVGTGDAISIIDLVSLLGNITQQTPVMNFMDSRPGDIKHSCACVQQLQKHFNLPGCKTPDAMRRMALTAVVASQTTQDSMPST